jgi:uncharacterized protein
MPLVTPSTYVANPFWGNKHLQTILPSLTRKVRNVKFERQRIEIYDGDFLDLDWLKNPSNLNTKKLAIITHGLEGSATKSYSLGMSKMFFQAHYDVLAWNQRSCSGEPNRLLRFYHAGATQDLEAVIKCAISLKKYEEIYLIGFSLGGNMTLKYLGEVGNDLPLQVKKAVVFSTPLHLSSCSEELCKRGNLIYTRHFIRKLKRKVRLKAKLMPTLLNIKPFKHIRALKDFDDKYTAPLHDFVDAEDYYEKSSSIYYLPQITIKTLIVNALNDSFLGDKCYPTALVAELPNIYLEIPVQGGHCGFAPADKQGFYWSERRALEFCEA